MAVMALCILLGAGGLIMIGTDEASAAVSGDWEYTLSSGKATLTKYNGIETQIIIPAEIEGYIVTNLADSCLRNQDKITSITIPDSVTSISSYAFNGCTGLTSITIPDSVTSIGINLLNGCTSLTSASISNSVKNLKESIFYGCTSLTSVSIGNSVTSISTSAFNGCTSLTSITIPDSVTSIGNYAFYGCTSLTSITIPDSVTSIGDQTFYGCTGLTSITIPDSVTSISSYAFYGCTSLTSITIPDSVTSIGSSAFNGCTGLTSITIPDSVTSIGSSAFNGCTGLTSITIPDSVTSIGSSAFSGCTGLTSITIPDGVTSIGNYAFSGCTNLETAYVKSKTVKFENSFPAETMIIDYNRIVIDSNGGSPIYQMILLPTEDNYGKLPIPSKDGYTFAGWIYTANGSTTWAPPEGTINSDITMIAIWTASIGPSIPESQTIDIGTEWNYKISDVPDIAISIYGAKWLDYIGNGTVSGAPDAYGSYDIVMVVSAPGYTTEAFAFSVDVPAPPIAEHTVIIRGPDGIIVSTITVSDGATAVKPTAPEGKTVTYYTDSDTTTEFDWSSAITSDVTIYRTIADKVIDPVPVEPEDNADYKTGSETSIALILVILITIVGISLFLRRPIIATIGIIAVVAILVAISGYLGDVIE